MESFSVPFRQFVLKVHSRCDLACDHCYVYEHEDTSWRGRPKVASEEVLARTAERIAEHARSHRLDLVHVVLHGGEPLLAGPALLRRAGELLHKALDGVCALDLRIHTNGVQLSERYCELFLEQNIAVGISLDGDRAANDLHRRYADGRSSHAKVLKAVELLNRPRYRPLYAGLLCTVDVRNNPVAVYDALLELRPPRIDFLLPHATWDTPPLRPEGAATPYADWLRAVYDRWDAQGRPVPVRMFDSIHSTLRGGASLTESLGLDPADLVVIETDGTLEQADSLKTAFDGAPATGFDVFADDLDTAARHPGMIDRQGGLASLSAACRACPVVRSCGGGLYAHRYRTGSDFDNPSVFCDDLYAFITEVRDREQTGASAAGRPGEAATMTAGIDQTELTEAQFDELAAGYGSADLLRTLTALQLELNRQLLAEVWSGAEPTPKDRAAWARVTELDEAAGDALDQVLAHPYTRAWAAGRLRMDSSGPAVDLGGIAEIAAAAALRAGAGGPVVVPVRGGLLRLPTLGVLRLDGAREARVAPDGPHRFTVDWAGQRLRLPLHRPAEGAADAAFEGAAGRGAADDPRWLPLRRVALGPGLSLALDDTDPLRDRYGAGHAATGRLGQAEYRAWAQALAGARRLVERALPRYAPGLAEGLAVVTPLVPVPGGRGSSAATRHSYGAVGIARPPADDLLALLLVHEFQHVKLGAAFDLYDLFDPEHERRYRAPWRPDPRPLEGLFQGTYAHLGVTEFWLSRVRDHREHGSPEPVLRHAEEEFVRWRDYTAAAVRTLGGSGALTRLGERFAVGMRATVTPWMDEPVGRGVEAAVAERVARDEAAWADRHGAVVAG